MDHQLTTSRASNNAEKRVACCYANGRGEPQSLYCLIHRASGVDGAVRIIAMKVSTCPERAAENQTLLVKVQFSRWSTSCSQIFLK